MMDNTVLVTGASGQLGREVVRALLADGFAVKAATRDASKVPPQQGVTPVTFDYTDPATFAAALEGATGLFLVAPPMDADAPAKLIPFIEKARSAGIGHVVFNSALGMDQNEEAPLRIVERAVMDSGIPYTILRPNFFMENFSTGSISPMIREQNSIFLAAGDGKTSFISTRDIAAVAAAALAGTHAGCEYNLTGPEALDHGQVARMISEATGKQITYQALPEMIMLQGARNLGMPEPMVQYMRGLYAAVRSGDAAVVTDDVKKITGRTPITFDEFANDNAECWG